MRYLVRDRSGAIVGEVVAISLAEAVAKADDLVLPAPKLAAARSAVTPKGLEVEESHG